MDNAQNPTGPVLTAAESRRRVLHNMCSSLLYNLSVILFGLLLPRLYLTSFGSELNGLDSTIKQIFSCLTLLEAGVGLASQQAYYLPVAVGDRKAINGIFSATHHYYRRTGIVYLLVTVVFALLYPLCINTVLSYGTVSLIVVFYGIPGIVSYLVQGKYRSFMEVEGKNYVITYITTATMAAGNLLRMLALLFTRSILLVQVTYCVPSVFQVLVLTAYMRKNYPWLNAHDTPNLEALAQRGSVLVHQLTGIVFNNTDTILISSLCGLASASVYTIYMLFLYAANILSAGVALFRKKINFTFIPNLFVFGTMLYLLIFENAPRRAMIAVPFMIYNVIFLLSQWRGKPDGAQLAERFRMRIHKN